MEQEGPSERVRFIFAVFGAQPKKSGKSLWKLLRHKVTGRGSTVTKAARLIQKTGRVFNFTSSESVNEAELKAIRDIIKNYHKKAAEINNIKCVVAVVARGNRLIEYTIDEINKFLPTVDGKWLEGFGLINARSLAITRDVYHFTKLQSECEIYKTKKCRRGSFLAY